MRGAIDRDRAAGLRPFLIVGTAGGVNFGAFDDLAALADIAAAERLWLHVDGAFGALTRLSPSLAPLTRGLERADSVAFDFHKWAHAPYDAGFLLVRDPVAHKATFAAPAAYLSRAAARPGGRRGLALRLRPGPVARFPRAEGVADLPDAGRRRHRPRDRGQLRRRAASGCPRRRLQRVRAGRAGAAQHRLLLR